MPRYHYLLPKEHSGILKDLLGVDVVHLFEFWASEMVDRFIVEVLFLNVKQKSPAKAFVIHYSLCLF